MSNPNYIISGHVEKLVLSWIDAVRLVVDITEEDDIAHPRLPRREYSLERLLLHFVVSTGVTRKKVQDGLYLVLIAVEAQ